MPHNKYSVLQLFGQHPVMQRAKEGMEGVMPRELGYLPRKPNLEAVTCPPCCKQTICGWSGGRRETTRSPVLGFT